MSRIAQLLLGLLLLMTFVAALPAAAGPAVAAGRIYFQAFTTGNQYDVFSMNPDGSDVVQLTDNPAYDTSPAVSPDGRRVLFVSERDGNREIYVMNADGSDETRLTHEARADFDPAWSPDGQSVAFVSARETTDELFTMTADGDSVTNITQHVAAEFNWQPTWSPDGTRLAFGSGREGMEEIYAQTLGQPVDENNPVRLTTSETWDGGWSGYPEWSPDGQRLVYILFHRIGQWMEQDVYVMDADGGNPTALTYDSFTDRAPDWSPDGTQIAFDSNRDGPDRRRIYVMDADGSDISGPLISTSSSSPSWGVMPAGRAKLTVAQVVAGAPPAARWHFSGPLGGFILPAAGGSRSLIYLDPQTTTVSQIAMPGYTTTAVCSNGVTGGASVTLTLANDTPVTCTFTSTYQSTPVRLFLPAVRRP
jgi:dipeptidyl aminopeptidase/acylaminoacyl peptidase